MCIKVRKEDRPIVRDLLKHDFFEEDTAFQDRVLRPRPECDELWLKSGAQAASDWPEKEEA